MLLGLTVLDLGLGLQSFGCCEFEFEREKRDHWVRRGAAKEGTVPSLGKVIRKGSARKPFIYYS